MLDQLLKKFPTGAPVVFLILMVLLPYWKLTTMQGYVVTDDIFASDIMNEGFPYRYYISEALKSGELPTWLPHIYGGIPLLARAEAGVCYPLNLILFGLLNPYTALNIVILLMFITAALGMYFFVRELDVTVTGAVIAALSFAYSGFMVSHIKHLSMVGTVCWFPVGLLAIERAFKRHDQAAKSLLILSIIFGLQNLSGHIQTAYYSGVAYIFYYLFRFLNVRRAVVGNEKKNKRPAASAVGSPVFVSKRHAWSFVGALVLGTGISAVQLLPTYELVSLTQRSGGVTFDYAANYAYDPSNIKTFLYPYANGDIGNATYRGSSIFWEDYGYVGLVPLLLAIFAAARVRKSWHVKWFAIGAVGAYVLVLGPNTPVYEAVFHLVPGMSYFRFPTRFLFIVDAALAVLAAIGITRIVASVRRERKGVLSVLPLELAVLAVVAVDLLFFQLRQNPIVDAEKWLAPPSTVQILKEDKDLFRIYSPGASETHKVAFSLAQGWLGSLQPYIDQREFVQPSSNVLYGISTADGYAQLTPNYVVDVWGDQNRSGLIMKTATVREGEFIPKPTFLRIMNLFNVKYLLSPWPIRSDELKPMQDGRNVLMYGNPSVMPRAFVVGGYRVARTSEQAEAILLSTDFDPVSEVILHEDPAIAQVVQGGVSSATVEHYATNEVIVGVSSEKGGFLVLSETFYPGWRATVDGVDAPILRANFCQRAIAVPPGEHNVRFEFSSSTVTAGFAISLCSLLAACVGLFFLGKKK
ncbi:MAG: YfhO family protein [Ignavibacteriae bacterium]|nr:YfhO family protein [Ignavibacteriota bacterium]